MKRKVHFKRGRTFVFRCCILALLKPLVPLSVHAHQPRDFHYHSQQTITVSGTVRDKNGSPLSAVSVMLKDHPIISTKTNEKGHYELKNVPTTATFYLLL